MAVFKNSHKNSWNANIRNIYANLKFVYIYSWYSGQKIIKYCKQRVGNKIKITDGHPLQEKKNEVKVAKNNVFHVVNH